MYGKLFAQMYDGTLGTKGPWQALVTFQQLIILADKKGEVDMTAEAIARRTTIPLKVIQVGIDALEQPDPHSRTPDEDGRRIVKLSDNRDWGWRVVNYDHYRKIRSAEERREYMKQYMRERRVNRSVSELAGGEQCQPIAVSSRQYVGSSMQEVQKEEAVKNPPPQIPAEFHDEYAALLVRVPNGSSWRAEIAASMEGMHGPIRTGQQVGQAIRDYLANGKAERPSLRQFRAYLAGTVPLTTSPKAAGKPAWQVKKERDERDLYLNKDATPQAVAKAAIEREGQEWYERMKREAATAGRWVVPYIYDKEQGNG